MIAELDDTGELWQWDTDRYLLIRGAPDGCMVTFSQSDSDPLLVEPIKTDGHLRVPVPNIALQRSLTIGVYLAVDGMTIAHYALPVKSRPKPADYIYVETEVRDFESLETWVKKEIASIPQSAKYLTNAEFLSLASRR